MSYLKDFRSRLACNDYPGLLKIWEEYCYSDEIDGLELKKILEEAKVSSLKDSFGFHVEKGLSLWNKLTNPKIAHEVLRLIFDIQKTNSDTLLKIALEYLKRTYPDDPLFNEKLHLIGLKGENNFQGAISNYELLTHVKPGKFVFHTGGWGTSEVLDVSMVREEIVLECDLVVGQKSLSFQNAFHTLIPLNDDHFLSKRFGDPDQLEKQAKENPVEVIRLLLKDLGPKNAIEIKEELLDLVIPSKQWNRWWQTARAKIKKDTKIESPSNLKDPFRLREEEVPHEITLQKALEKKPGIDETIQMIYSFLRDFPETTKNQQFKTSLLARLHDTLSHEKLETYQILQLHFFLTDLETKKNPKIKEIILACESFKDLIDKVNIIAFKKRILSLVRKCCENWQETFLHLIFQLEQNILRDYLLIELIEIKDKKPLEDKIHELLQEPLSYPEAFVWYFQKIFCAKSKLPLSDQKNKNLFFENFLILLSHLNNRPQFRDLGKKMAQIISAKRYQIVQEIMKHSTLEELKEYLLLTTKCEFLSDHDIKIIQSLAEVIYPSLESLRKKEDVPEDTVIWTTAEGFQNVQQRISEIATSETVKNAKEIEDARALGDLRENAEFKAALEKRERLQSELKMLSDQLNHAKILIAEDVPEKEVGIGSVVICKDSKGKETRFTILGPWDADSDKQIISFLSKLAQSMTGKVVGDKFSFQNEEFIIAEIHNYFDQK